MRTAKKTSTTRKAATQTRAAFKPRLVVTNEAPQSEAERVAAYQAAMVEWHESQARAKKATAAYNRNVKRNARKAGPLAKVTASFAEHAEWRFLLDDHPNDCAVCLAAGAWDGESLVAAHRAVIARHSVEFNARCEQIESARDSYYDSGFKITIDGQPTRFASHVKQWKKSNRDSLCQGFDPYGLTLRPHGKYGFTDQPQGYWTKFSRYISSKELGTYHGVETQRLRAAGYNVTDWNEPTLFRNGHSELFESRRQLEDRKWRAGNGAIPNLFSAAHTSARVERRKTKAKLRCLRDALATKLVSIEANDDRAAECTRLIRVLTKKIKAQTVKR